MPESQPQGAFQIVKTSPAKQSIFAEDSFLSGSAALDECRNVDPKTWRAYLLVDI